MHMLEGRLVLHDASRPLAHHFCCVPNPPIMIPPKRVRDSLSHDFSIQGLFLLSSVCSCICFGLPDMADSIVERWDSAYLDRFAFRCFEKLLQVHPTALQLMSSLSNTRPALHWGSGCSGTDSPAWTFRALANAFQRHNVRFDFIHEFSAENDSRKQKFILRAAKPRFLLADMFDLSASRCTTVGDNLVVSPAKDFKPISFFIAGFVCKTVSRLNANKTEASTAVWNQLTSTGQTLWAALLFCERSKPVVVILENVFGLKRNNQHMEVARRLENIGYSVIIFESNPCMYNFPHDRHRLYFLAILSSRLDACGRSKAWFADLCKRCFEAMRVGHPCLPLDELLYDESDHFALEMKDRERATLAARAERIGTRTAKVERWVHKHKELSSACASTAWRDCLAEHYPGYLLLSDRCKDLLDHEGCQFPHPRPLVLNISQTKASGGIGHVPCLTPGGIFWVAHRARQLYGREALQCQGLYVSDWQALVRPDPQHDELTDALFADMAGNAFCTVSVLPVQMLGLLLIAETEIMSACVSSGSGSSSDIMQSPASPAKSKSRSSSPHGPARADDIMFNFRARKRPRVIVDG
jgi:site-specific DNA-cytosine methylase